MAAIDGPPRTALEMAVAERNAVALGIPVERLMDGAGRVVAEEVLGHVAGSTGRIVVLAGAGNNGGDGVSAVHHLLSHDRKAELWMVAGSSATRSIAARRCFERLAGRVEIREGPPNAADLTGAALVVDALLGTGQSGTLRGPYLAAVEAVDGSKAPVLSVDLPTGFGGTPSLRPSWTVTLSSPKVGLESPAAGSITVRSIGIPEAAFDRTGPGEFLAYPAPTHRGRSARIAVVGGGPFSGAPALAALAALRAGAERATIHSPSPAADAIRAFSPDLVVVPQGTERLRPGDVEPILSALRSSRVGAVVIGMGLGRADDTVAAARHLIDELVGTVPLVVDADALDALPNELAESRLATIVATPNEGEFARVFGGPVEPELPARRSQVAAAARARGITIVLKGREDVVAGNERIGVCGPHSPSANVGGSGDVLAGVIGRLLAGGLPPVAAGRLATQWLDDAGRRVAAKRGDGLLATDLLAQLPAALVEGLRSAPLG